MRTNTQTIKRKHLAMLAVLLTTLLATLLLVACVAPVAMPAATPTTAPGPKPAAREMGSAGEPVTVALPQTQPQPSLVMLDAGSITVTAPITSTEAITGNADPPEVGIRSRGPSRYRCGKRTGTTSIHWL